MNKKKRYLKRFTNWLFNEYKAPRIPVRIMYNCDAIIDGETTCDGYFGDDNGKTVILVAAKKLGLSKCRYVVAHEFVHYMQKLNGRNMEEEIIEEDADTFGKALVGKYLINHEHIGERIDSVLDVSVPVRLLEQTMKLREEQDAAD